MREGGGAAQEGADRPQHHWQLVLRLELIGATLEDAAHGAIAPVASIQRSLAGALESFSSEPVHQTQNALRLAEVVERVIHEEFTNQLVGGWADRVGLAQTGLRRGAQECLGWFGIVLHPR